MDGPDSPPGVPLGENGAVGTDDERDGQRTIPDPGFPDDRGEADPALAEALASHRAGSAPSGRVLAALQDARLLVPVVAVLGEVEVDDHGLAHDKTSDMAAVLVQNAAGSTGLLAFTSLATLQRWDPEARPVPVPAATAATAAVQDGAAALLVDLAGPASYAVTGEDLTRLAAGWRLVGLGSTGEEDGGEGYGWIGPTGE